MCLKLILKKIIAKKIPLEHLSSSRSRTGLNTAAGGAGGNRVDLNADPNANQNGGACGC